MSLSASTTSAAFAMSSIVRMMGFSHPKVLMARIASSLATRADIKTLLMVAAIFDFGVFGLGSAAGLFKWQPMPNAQALGWSVVYVTARAVIEELIFRSAMLPHPKVDGAHLWQPRAFIMHAIIPMLLFTISHAWTTRRKPETVLRDRFFLFNAANIGVACTWAYWHTRGSLFGAALMHFLIVLPYMALVGGYKALHVPTPMRGEGVSTFAGTNVKEKARVMAPAGPESVAKTE